MERVLTTRAWAAGTLAIASMTLWAAALHAEEVQVCVSQQGAGAVTGATVLLANDDDLHSLRTAADGCVSVDARPGAYTLTVVAPGTIPHEAELIVPAGAGGVSEKVALESQPVDDVIVVAAERDSASVETRRQLDPDMVRTIPGVGGDALKAVQNLPGMARSPLATGALLVRGAAPEDSLVLLDGQRIPQLYHFGGVTSVVATDMLSDIDFLPGGFGVRYGRVMGGVVDAESQGARSGGIKGTVDADLYDASLVGEMPLGSDGRYGSVMAAARRSYVDAIIPVVMNNNDDLAFSVAPRYYDYQLHYTGPQSAAGDQWHVLVYGCDDEETFVVKDPPPNTAAARGRFYLHTLFHRVQGEWSRPLGGDWLITVWPGAGFQTGVVDASGLASVDAQQQDLTLRAEARGSVSPRLNLMFGAEALYTPTKFTVFLSSELLNDDELRRKASYHQVIGAAYAQAELELLPGLTTVGGVRVDAFAPVGKASVDPRLAIRYAPRDFWFVKAYAGLYSEPPNLGQWDAEDGNPNLAIQHAVHTGIGGGLDLGASTSIEAEVFWKWMDNLIATIPPDPTDPLATPGMTNDGIGRAYGAELMLRREMSEDLYGWISYTLSRSERADPYTPGGWKPFNFDQTHILTAVASYRLGKGWELGARFRYATGNPMTPMAGAIYDADADAYIPLPGETNGERLPDFHQLDVRISKRIELDRLSLDAYFDVQNVYNRANPEIATYDFDFDNRYYVTGLPVFPSFGLRGEF